MPDQSKNDLIDALKQYQILNQDGTGAFDEYRKYTVDAMGRMAGPNAINEFVCPTCKYKIQQYASQGDVIYCNHASAFYGAPLNDPLSTSIAYSMPPTQMVLVRQYPDYSYMPNSEHDSFYHEMLERKKYEMMRRYMHMRPQDDPRFVRTFDEAKDMVKQKCAHKWVGKLGGLDHTSPNQREFYEECDVCKEKKK